MLSNLVLWIVISPTSERFVEGKTHSWLHTEVVVIGDEVRTVLGAALLWNGLTLLVPGGLKERSPIARAKRAIFGKRPIFGGATRTNRNTPGLVTYRRHFSMYSIRIHVKRGTQTQVAVLYVNM
jgi:hypothetical protein